LDGADRTALDPLIALHFGDRLEAARRALLGSAAHRAFLVHATSRALTADVPSTAATGITVYLKNGGLLEHAQQMAAHESARTTKLYDRRNDKVTLDEVEKIML